MDAEKKHLWKTSGYIYVMYHNTHFLVKQLEEIHDYFDLPRSDSKVYFPKALFDLEDVLMEIFRPGADYEKLIDQHRDLLNNCVAKEFEKFDEEGVSLTFSSLFAMPGEHESKLTDETGETGAFIKETLEDAEREE